MSPFELTGIAALFAKAINHIMDALQTPAGIIAYASATVAATLIVVSSFVKTMIPLRWLAVGSNLGFAAYGVLETAPVTLCLAGILLPINVYRALEMTRLTRTVARASSAGETGGVWLRPYMRTRHLKAGEILFRKNDIADHLYLLADGQLEFSEIGQTMDAGRIFGEIAFFAPDKRRTQTARCVTDCTVLSIDESTVKQLYFQNPAFGFELVGLVAARLSADVRRLEQASAKPAS